MEGFFDIKIAVWKRVFLTRAIAILPALSVAFIHNYSELDTALNILQSIQLPFALIPLIKFTSSEKIMGSFANKKWVTYLAIFFGILLFIANVIGMLPEESKFIH